MKEMIKELKEYINEEIKDCDRERNLCLRMKPKPLTALAQMNFIHKNSLNTILIKIEQIEEKNNK